MSRNEPLMIEDAVGDAAPEIFALTDEQILGMEPEGQGVDAASSGPQQLNGNQDPSTAAARNQKSAQPGMAVPQEMAQEPPGWLAQEMKDPWVGKRRGSCGKACRGRSGRRRLIGRRLLRRRMRGR